MKITDLKEFKKQVEQKPPSLCLVIGKEADEAIEALLKAWKSPCKTYEAEDFSLPRFLEECDTLPFLVSKTFIHLKQIDKLGKEELEGISTYLTHPASWVYLLLSGEQLALQSAICKKIEEKGVCLRLAEEKPWEKEKQLIEWLIHEAQANGLHLGFESAKTLVKASGNDRQTIRNELDKLICFAGKKREITIEDIQSLCTTTSQENFWQLGEAIFLKRADVALSIGRHLMQEETIFPLLSHLRTQMRQALDIFSHYQEGGAEAVSRSFPYLKGKLLQKKIEETTRYGEKRLYQALILLFEAEILAKNSSRDPKLILEILLVNLTN